MEGLPRLAHTPYQTPTPVALCICDPYHNPAPHRAQRVNNEYITCKRFPGSDNPALPYNYSLKKTFAHSLYTISCILAMQYTISYFMLFVKYYFSVFSIRFQSSSTSKSGSVGTVFCVILCRAAMSAATCSAVWPRVISTRCAPSLYP